MIDSITPEWPYRDRVQVLTTTRLGGVSRPPYESLNLADHVGDERQDVMENRRRLQTALDDRSVCWLQQVHGNHVVRASAGTGAPPRADAMWTQERELVLAVLTADCLPVVVLDKQGGSVAVVHGGWRGLAAGILSSACAALPGSDLAAWIGPGIGPEHYEVGADVLEPIKALGSFAVPALLQGKREGKGYLDLFTLATLQLAQLGIEEVYCERRCTAQSLELYSYRRDGRTGRMATLAWLI